MSVSRAFFDISPEFLNKSSSDQKNLTILLKALGEEHPPMFPKMGPLCNSEQRRNFNLEN
jgi:hypothetical protein